MSDNEIRDIKGMLGTVFTKLDGLADRLARQETKMDSMKETSDKDSVRLEKLTVNGCARYPEHIETQDTVKSLDVRVRTLEGDKNLVRGWAAGISIVGGGVGSWLKGLLGGG